MDDTKALEISNDLQDSLETGPLWEEEWEFVKRTLLESGNDSFGGGKQSHYPFRSRYEHTRRVMKWIHRIMEDMPNVDREILEVATIFHDVGYSRGLNHEHGFYSAEIFLEYANEHQKFQDKKETIAWIVEHHSDKSLLMQKVPPEMILLQEADMLDEEGAMRIAWDCMAEGVNGATSFRAALDHTLLHFNPDYDPMVTPRANEIWQQKKEFVKDYIRRLEFDLEDF